MSLETIGPDLDRLAEVLRLVHRFVDEPEVGGRRVWLTADVVERGRVCRRRRQRDDQLAHRHAGLKPAARADAHDLLDTELDELLDHDRGGRAAHAARLHRDRLPLERARVAEHPALAVPLDDILHEGLGDVLGSKRIAWEEAGFRVVTGVCAHMNRHGRKPTASARAASLCLEFSGHVRETRRADAGGDSRLLRRRPGRARLPRGCRASRHRPVHRDPRRRRSPPSAVPPRHQHRPFGRGLRGVCRGCGEGRPSHADRRRAGRQRALGGGRSAGSARRARTGPASPSTSCASRPSPVDSGLRPATLDDLDFLLPACAAAHAEELGIDPLARDAPSYRWRTRVQIEEGRSWLWEEDRQIQFKAEASAWTPTAVQLQQVWVDPPARRRGQAARGLRDLARLLLRDAEVICLFVRRENEAAIRLYESIGMQRVLSYRSVLLCGS